MAIKVVIPSGTSTKSVEGLFQWDFGQALEIECTEIGSEIVEVHFACAGMSEAIVRPCTFSDGIGTVVIPDQCLEQTSSITAWIYKIDSTQGHTIKTITVPISPRTRPGKAQNIPTEYVDRYSELIEQMNNAVNAIKNGEITAKKALEADHATKADSATNAGTATYATKAANADKATEADRATTATRLDSNLIATCKITNGQYKGMFAALKYQKLCTVVFINEAFIDDDNVYETHCGVYYEHSGSYLHYARIGMFDMVISEDIIRLTKDGATVTNANGTLYFYQLGG